MRLPMGPLNRIGTPRREVGVENLDELTPSELDVLALMSQGLSNSAIADYLVVSERTVEAHIHHVFLKLGLRPSKDSHRRVLAANAYVRWAAGVEVPLRVAG